MAKTRAKGKKKDKYGSLRERYDRSYSTKDDGANSSSNQIFDFSKVEIKEDLFFTTKDIQWYRINIVPFEIKTKKHPDVVSGSAKIGQYEYVLDFWSHRAVGPGKVDVVCPAKTYNKKCPICEESEAMKSKGDMDAHNALKARRRVCYNIQDLKNKDIDHLQLFMASHFLFEKPLIADAYNTEDGDRIEFSHPEYGTSISFRTEKGQNWIEFAGFKFSERDPIPEDLVDSAISLDEILIVKTYDELSELLYGADLADDEEESEEEEEYVEEDEYDGIEDEDEEEDEEEEEEEPPKPKRKRKSSKATPKKTPKKKNKCPHGHKFGVDVDEFDECEDCEFWEKCSLANDEIEEDEE